MDQNLGYHILGRWTAINPNYFEVHQGTVPEFWPMAMHMYTCIFIHAYVYVYKYMCMYIYNVSKAMP